MIFASVWNQEPMIQKFEEDGNQRDGEAAVYTLKTDWLKQPGNW